MHTIRFAPALGYTHDVGLPKKLIDHGGMSARTLTENFAVGECEAEVPGSVELLSTPSRSFRWGGRRDGTGPPD